MLRYAHNFNTHKIIVSTILIKNGNFDNLNKKIKAYPFLVLRIKVQKNRPFSETDPELVIM